MRLALRALLAALSGIALSSGMLAQEQTPPDVPAGDARIEGRVLQGEANRPVSGVEVVLYALSADGTPGLRRMKSDANGRYAFDNVSSA
jgi:5-hydroxyisourate hydrolase-like protein (transthyretin family)